MFTKGLEAVHNFFKRRHPLSDTVERLEPRELVPDITIQPPTLYNPHPEPPLDTEYNPLHLHPRQQPSGRRRRNTMELSGSAPFKNPTTGSNSLVRGYAVRKDRRRTLSSADTAIVDSHVSHDHTQHGQRAGRHLEIRQQRQPPQSECTHELPPQFPVPSLLGTYERYEHTQKAVPRSAPSPSSNSASLEGPCGCGTRFVGGFKPRSSNHARPSNPQPVDEESMSVPCISHSAVEILYAVQPVQGTCLSHETETIGSLVRSTSGTVRHAHTSWHIDRSYPGDPSSFGAKAFPKSTAKPSLNRPEPSDNYSGTYSDLSRVTTTRSVGHTLGKEAKGAPEGKQRADTSASTNSHSASPSNVRRSRESTENSVNSPNQGNTSKPRTPKSLPECATIGSAASRSYETGGQFRVTRETASKARAASTVYVPQCSPTSKEPRKRNITTHEIHSKRTDSACDGQDEFRVSNPLEPQSKPIAARPIVRPTSLTHAEIPSKLVEKQQKRLRRHTATTSLQCQTHGSSIGKPGHKSNILREEEEIRLDLQAILKQALRVSATAVSAAKDVVELVDHLSRVKYQHRDSQASCQDVIAKVAPPRQYR